VPLFAGHDPGAPETTSGRTGPEGCASGDATTLKEIVAAFACGGVGEASARAKLHERFDDRTATSVEAAVLAGVGGQDQYLEVGLTRMYADLVDEKSLPRQLAAFGLSPPMADAFVANYRAAVAKADEGLQKLPARIRDIYLKIPRGVVTTRRAYYKKHASSYKEVDEARKAAQSAATDEERIRVAMTFGQIRRAYLAKSVDDDARFDPLVIEATRESAVLYARAGRHMLLDAEVRLLQEPQAGKHLFETEVSLAMYVATKQEEKEFKDYVAAKQSGLSEQDLLRRFGGQVPVQMSSESLVPGADRLPHVPIVGFGRMLDWSAILGPNRVADWSTVAGVVGSVSLLSNRKRRISFRDDVDAYQNEDCHDTAKVESLTWSGGRAHVNYERVCTPAGTKVFVTKIAPVTVSGEEGLRVRPNEYLTVLANDASREGVVVRSMSRGKKGDHEVARVLQVRESRLGDK
jgi:hypothetical protein